MEHVRGEAVTRGALAAASAVLGIPVVVHDGDAWSVRDGVAHVGLGWATVSGDPDDVVARALLLLWESVREVRVAPSRRSRRLALGGARPELEPLLAALDRLLAAAELLAALPNLRMPVVRAIVAAGWADPAELPRHLQWVSLVLDTAAARWASGGAGTAPYYDSLAPEVQRELAALDGAAGMTSGALLLALSPDPRRSPIERFERAYGLFAPAYLRLLALDIVGRGPQDGRAGGESADQDPGADAFDSSLAAADEQTDDGAGDDGAGDDGAGGETDGDEAPGGTATSDDDTEQARAGDRKDGAEGADLFAAEQAGFVETVLSTPLPASGSWVEGMELPDLARPDDADRDTSRDADHDRPDRATELGTPGGGGGAAALSSYRDRVTQHARSIERVRDVWRQIVSERVHLERAFSRTPEPEGDLLDRESLVRAVADAAAGVERPRAFLRRERRPRRSRREGSTDYVLLIDRSASMQGPAASAAATAALIMLEALAGVERDIAAEERALGIDLELSLRTALIVFDSTPLTVKPLAGALDDAARVALDSAIHAPQGSTNDAAALRAAATEFGLGGWLGSRQSSGPSGRPGSDAVSRRRIAILVSDGGTNDATAAARELARLRALGVTVFGIGINTDDLATRFAPDGMRLDAAEELPVVLERLVTEAGLGR